MELYHATTEAEKALCAKADITHTPIGGTMELLPLCNMNCKMCYIRMSKEEVEREGKMLGCDEWLRIADEGIKEGLLFLLITGGEPLIYPEFKRLYSALAKKGLILSVNTNGTLIDEEWAAFFAEHGCRRMSITLYGKDDDTYARLCGNPHGFSQVMRAAELLKAYHIPFRFTCSLTPQNADQLESMYAIAAELGVPLSVSAYMFPAMRKGRKAEEQYRLAPKEAAEAIFRSYRCKNPDMPMKNASLATLKMLYNRPRLHVGEGLVCRAGRSGFWMNWKGEMLPCGMFTEPRISLKEHAFKACWDYIVQETKQLPKCEKCQKCPKQNLCYVCPASNVTETGAFDGCPEYLCQLTDETLQMYYEYIK